MKEGHRMRSERLRMQLMAALFAGFTAICAQIHIPLPFTPVPETGQTVGLGLAAILLGSRYGALSAAIYVLLGAVGMRVFAGLSGGMHVIVGPTGGYIIAFAFAAFLIGWLMERREQPGILWAFVANVLGTVIILIAGTVQLKFVSGFSWQQAFFGGFVPFILGAVVKSFLAASIGVVLHRRLSRLGLTK